jgi:hypothetical protein
VKLISDLHLGWTSKMSGAIPQLPNTSSCLDASQRHVQIHFTISGLGIKGEIQGYSK